MKYATTSFIFTEVPEFLDIDEMKPGVVYVCNADGRADLLCPCGCGDRITISLVQGARPVWRISGNTIIPSINRTRGCRSHFSITNGKVS